MSDQEVDKSETNASKEVQDSTDRPESADVSEKIEDAPASDANAKEGSASREQSAANGEQIEKPAKAKKSTGRTPKGSKGASKAEEDTAAEDYSPGDSVQVKIQGYPWWPAIVVTPEHFPAAALAARPSNKTRKDGTSALTYPVQFLGTPEYYWSRPTDIKRLSEDEIKAWIDGGKKASTKGLKAAYQHAAMKPSLEQLMKAKTELEAQLAAQDEESEDEEMPDEDIEAAPEESEEDIELDDEGKPIKKSKSKKKASAKTPKKTPAKTPTKKRKTEDTDGEPSAKKARATPRGSARTKEKPAPSSPELSPEEARKKAHELKVKNVMFLRHKLQKCLLGKDEPDPKLLDEIPGYLDKLDSVEANVDLFRDTKIGKVLLRINKLEKIPRDEKLGIREHVAKLLEKWQEVMELQKKNDDDGTPKAEPTAAEDTKPTVADDKAESKSNGEAEAKSVEVESKDAAADKKDAADAKEAAVVTETNGEDNDATEPSG